VAHRLSPTDRIRRHIDELFSQDRPLPEIMEEVARLGGQRQVVGEAAGGDPGVVDRAGRPRRVAAADRLPQVTARVRLPGITGLVDSQSSSSARLRGPRWRNLVRLVISATVTKMRIGCRPTSRAASVWGSRPRKD
jgi:hypothetical protein